MTDLWETVEIGLEIDEPNEEKRKQMAKQAVENLVEKIGDNIIEEYHLVEKPIVSLKDGENL